MKKRKKRATSNRGVKSLPMSSVERLSGERKEKGKVAYMQIPYHVVGNIYIFLLITYIRHAVRYT